MSMSCCIAPSDRSASTSIATASSTSPTLCAVPGGGSASSRDAPFLVFLGLALALLLFLRFRGVVAALATRCISSSWPGSQVILPSPRSARTVLKSTPGGNTMYFSRAGVSRRHWTKQSSTQVWLTIGIDHDVALSVFVPWRLDTSVSVNPSIKGDSTHNAATTTVFFSADIDGVNSPPISVMSFFRYSRSFPV